MQKIKNIFKKILNKDGFVYKSLSKVYHGLSKFKYNVVNNYQILYFCFLFEYLFL